MRIISIVTTQENVVQDIQSFPVFEEQLSDEVVEQASECYVERVVEVSGVDHKSIEADDWRDIANETIDDGYCEVETYTVNLTWSYI